jgi:hypothetical protein
MRCCTIDFYRALEKRDGLSIPLSLVEAVSEPL